jgi:predicted acylesterase/phospholipase RssA
MRQLKVLLLASLALVFVAGVGTGAWIGSLAAATKEPRSLDRRVQDFEAVFDLTPTQVRQLREVLADFDQRKEKICQPTTEQSRELEALKAESRGRVRQLLTEEQRLEWDTRTGSR